VLADVKIVVVVGSVDLESIFSHVLSVKKDALDGSTVGLVVHVNLEAVGIVSFRVGRNDQSLEGSAEGRDRVTEKFGGSVS
jgi:hypothetical protein